MKNPFLVTRCSQVYPNPKANPLLVQKPSCHTVASYCVTLTMFICPAATPMEWDQRAAMTVTGAWLDAVRQVYLL